jgi:organic hydroperoxide reductase OsmC/OhrA
MARNQFRTVASCYECAALESCFGTKKPILTREQGRAKAVECQSLRKGITTETIQVEGQTKGMSRKKAEKLVMRHRARWVANQRIRLNPRV